MLRQGPSIPTRNWSIRREEPSIAITADLRPFVTHTGLTVKTALFLFVIVTHSSSMKGTRLNFHAEHELAGHQKTTFFSSFLQLQYPTYVVVVLFVVNQRSKLHTYRAEEPVLHTSVEVTFSITCRFIDGQGKRGNVHIPAIISVAFPDRSRIICTKNGTRNCQVCDTKSTTWCSWSISHDVICIPGAARYVIRNQPHDVHDRSKMMWYVTRGMISGSISNKTAWTSDAE